jgi:hypothetical protein
MTTFDVFWFGPPLNTLQGACFSSFVRRGHEMRLHVSEHMEVAAGIILVDASKTFPLSELFFSRIRSPATLMSEVIGTAGWIRTTDLLIHSQAL